MERVQSDKIGLLYGSLICFQLLLFVLLLSLAVACKRASPDSKSQSQNPKINTNQQSVFTSLGCLWQHVHFGGKKFRYKDYVNDILPHAQNTLTLCKNLEKEREPLLLRKESMAEFIFVELASDFFNALGNLELKNLTLSYQISLFNTTQKFKVISTEVAIAQLMKKVLFLPLQVQIPQNMLSENLQLLMQITLHYKGFEIQQIYIAPVVLY